MTALSRRMLLYAWLGLLLGLAVLLLLRRQGARGPGMRVEEEGWLELTDEELTA